MSLLSFEPFFRDDIYACIYHFRIRLPKTCCISASYADLSPSKNFFSRHLSPDKTRKSHLDFPGGGYFRFFPYSFVEKEMKKAAYSMTYFHLGDLLPVIDGVMTKEAYERYFDEPGTVKARYIRYMKTNLGVSGNKKKLFKLLNRMDFSSISEVDVQMDWSKAPIVTL